MGELLAVIGGALAGAFLTGVLAIYRDWRREVSDARAAKEVFLSEMSDASELVSEGIELEEWPLGWKRWSETWTDFRVPLARHVDPGAFASVARAYSRLYELEHGLEKGRRDFVDHDLSFFERVDEQVDAAHKALSKAQVSWRFGGTP